MLRGTVENWGRDSGYGYIKARGGGRYWFHADSIVCETPRKQRNMLKGQLVVFEPGVTKRGPIAVSVRPLRPGEELKPAEVGDCSPNIDTCNSENTDAHNFVLLCFHISGSVTAW
jgi:cold shock CspA family protein